MTPLAYYLQAYHIEPLSLSIIAQVRYITVWNAVKGNPITPEHAVKIRFALHKITGTPFTGMLPTIQEQTIEAQHTQPTQAVRGRRGRP